MSPSRLPPTDTTGEILGQQDQTCSGSGSGSGTATPLGFRVVLGALFGVLLVALLMTIASADRLGSSFGYAGHDVKTGRWVVFFTLVPIGLLALYAGLAGLQAVAARRGISTAFGSFVGLVVFTCFVLISSVSVLLTFDHAWVTNTPNSLATRTRAAGWLGLAFFTSGVAYFAHAVFSNLRVGEGGASSCSWWRYWAFGAVPTVLVAGFAFVIYATDPH